MTLPGAEPDETNPLPHFRRQTGFSLFKTKGVFPAEAAAELGAATLNLPYRTQDRYGRERKPLILKTAVLENEYLRAVFTPEYGGKLWSLFDKENERELLMSNPVLQPGNLAIRNAWLSGGVEWNFGSLGHTYFTCDDVWAAAVPGDDGEFLRIYEYERAKDCIFQIDFHLPEGSRQLFSHVKLINPDNETKTVYWWTNTAIPDDGGTRVLSSSDDVIVVCGSGGVTYEKLPYLSVMDGDLSYPDNATRSFDCFFQPEKDVVTTWEGGVNKDGYAFYDRSTSPLVYHKMFCWGNHAGGARWQEFLSDGDKGKYIELQAGIARSQLHDKLFPANSSFEWTQCFGGAKVGAASVHGVDLKEANANFEKEINALIPEQTLVFADEKYKKYANIPVSHDSIVHNGSGWGALEVMRRKKENEEPLPRTVCFPSYSLGKEQKDWVGLLDDGYIKSADPGAIPPSWMTSKRFMTLIEKSFDSPDAENWYSLLHYGNMLFEYWDNSVIANEAVNWSEKDKYEKAAEAAWRRSDALTPNVWAKRNLAVLYRLRGEKSKAEQEYDELIKLPAFKTDFAFAAEYMGWLNEDGKYEKAWELFVSLPDDMKKKDRIVLHAAKSAIRLGSFDFAKDVFDREYAIIREGETSLSDLWFEFKARELAKTQGKDFKKLTDNEKKEYFDLVENTLTPPHTVDFRMSTDKNNKYREIK